jgi:hypothetical protein
MTISVDKERKGGKVFLFGRDGSMNNIEKLMAIGEKKIGILFIKRLFCVLLILFEIDKKTIVEKFKVSRPTVKKYKELAETGNIEGIFADTVYRRRSEMED